MSLVIRASEAPPGLIGLRYTQRFFGPVLVFQIEGPHRLDSQVPSPRFPVIAFIYIPGSLKGDQSNTYGCIAIN